MEVIQHTRDIFFSVMDTGGNDARIRPLWRHCFHGQQGVVFVVDATDVGRMCSCSSGENDGKSLLDGGEQQGQLRSPVRSPAGRQPENAADFLTALLLREELKDAVFLILANKVDLVKEEDFLRVV